MISRPRARLLLFALLLTVACGRGEGDPRLDRVNVRARLDTDEAVVKLLGEANLLVAHGKPKEALALVDEKITPLAGENATRAREGSARTEWGKTQAAAARSLVEDRQASVKAYRDALVSDDVEKVVLAMEIEKPLDQRALALAAAIDSPPARQGCSMSPL